MSSGPALPFKTFARGVAGFDPVDFADFAADGKAVRIGEYGGQRVVVEEVRPVLEFDVERERDQVERFRPRHLHVAHQPGVQIVEVRAFRVDAAAAGGFADVQHAPAGEGQHQYLVGLGHPEGRVSDRMVEFVTADQVRDDVPLQIGNH